MSAIALLTEHERLLKRVFVRTEFSLDGVYQLRLCHDGRWQIVFTLFLCLNDSSISFSFLT